MSLSSAQDAICIASVPLGEKAEPDAFHIVYQGTIQAHDLTQNAEELQQVLRSKLDRPHDATCKTETNKFGGVVVVHGIHLNSAEGVELIAKCGVNAQHKGIASAKVQPIGLNGQGGGLVYSMAMLKLELGVADMPPNGHRFSGVADWGITASLPRLQLMLEIHDDDTPEIDAALEGVCRDLHVSLHQPVVYHSKVMSPLQFKLRS